ncbi:MAG: DUF2254 domain-containing protein [Rhizobiales bacterium]|nr:DUF2254 domain-containing protein [Hyphomicrobiales bacterium]
MTNDLKQLFITIKSSFWLLPMIMSTSGVIAAIFILDLDYMLQGLGLYSYFSSISMPIETVRLVLSTTAGAMITVVSLVFSMTLVALILVSQQLGPRILIQFMDDLQTQITLGLFNATFLFSLIVLVRIDTSASTDEVKGVVIIISVLLTIASIITLIHYIHHLAKRIQADVIVSELGSDLEKATRQYVRQSQEIYDHIETDDYDELMQSFEAKAFYSVVMKNSGIIQQFNETSAFKYAKENNLIFVLKITPGEFLLSGRPLMHVYQGETDEEVCEDKLEVLSAFFSVSKIRTPIASINFEINAITEVALRALSPGVNDPQTAVFCINQLAVGLMILMEVRNQPKVLKDDEDITRILYKKQTYNSYLHQAFDGIIDACASNQLVKTHLAKILDELSALGKSEGQQACFEKFRKQINIDQ